LPDDVIVYYEPVIRRRYPNFIVLAPSLGVIVIEVKGIPLAWINHVDSHVVRYTQGGRPQEQAHPARQAKDYMRNLMDACRAHPRAGEFFADGRFRFAFSHLAILTAIRSDDLAASPWAGFFPPGQTLCDDRFEQISGSPDALLSAMRQGFLPGIPLKPIAPEGMTLIRSVVSPSSCVEPGVHSLPDANDRASLDLLDHAQERVARQIGSGHRILYGVPGSGKTVVLVASAKLLGEAGRSTLVLCYNHALKRYFEGRLAQHPSVTVRTFGEWARSQGAKANLNDEESFGQGIRDILRAGRGEAGRYDAVLIDEGQDFRPSWFESATLALKEPADGTLLVAYDLSQNLYGASLPTWSSVGVKARGRTRRFTKNYRNTREIVTAAWSFGLQPQEADEDRPAAVALSPEACIRSGPRPILERAASQDAQIARCIEIAKDLMSGFRHPDGGAVLAPAKDIMVLCVRNALRERVAEAFAHQGFDIPTTTIHGARGLQAKAVILVGAEELQGDLGRRLMYVALTRPTDLLFVLWSHDSPHLKELARNLDGGA
jgi:hypothetical protein